MNAELIKSLILISSWACLATFFLNRYISSNERKSEAKQYCTYLIVVTSIAFLLPKLPLVYAGIALFFLFLIPKKNKIPAYLALLFALPIVGYNIPGFGGINYFIELNYPRIATLALLFPFFITLIKKQKILANGTDRLVLYIFLYFSIYGLFFYSPTNALRHIIEMTLDIAIPYVVISRSINEEKDLKRLFFALLFGITLVAGLGLFESLLNWNLYDIFSRDVGEVKQAFRKSQRAGLTRASVVFGSSIFLGTMLMIGLAISSHTSKFNSKNFWSYGLTIALIGAEITTFSRGPWLGMICLVFLLSATKRNALKKVAGKVFIGALCLLLISLTTFGSELISLIPGFSSDDTHHQSTINYRTDLISASWDVFLKNPIIGIPNFIEDPDLEKMRQGQGIIDMVNSYIQIALKYGLIGLLLFIAIIYRTCINLYVRAKPLENQNTYIHSTYLTLFCTIIAFSVILLTVSFINYMPVVFWVLVGISTGALSINTNKTDLTQHG